MQQREKGYTLDTAVMNSRPECQPLTFREASAHSDCGPRYFSSDVSRLPGFSVSRGGLVADSMGLGKTLQMISLIASDCESRDPSEVTHAVMRNRCFKPQIPATLVVLPLSCEYTPPQFRALT